MTARVQKWGNSLAIRIPRSMAQESRLTQGCTVTLRAANGRLFIELQRAPKHKLGDLLRKVTRRNIHAEVATGGPVGQEAL